MNICEHSIQAWIPLIQLKKQFQSYSTFWTFKYLPEKLQFYNWNTVESGVKHHNSNSLQESLPDPAFEPFTCLFKEIAFKVTIFSMYRISHLRQILKQNRNIRMEFVKNEWFFLKCYWAVLTSKIKEIALPPKNKLLFF